MGSRMVRKLSIDGFQLNIYNRSPIQEHTYNKNVNFIDNLDKLYSESNILISMVTDDYAINDILFDKDQNFKIKKHSILINTSTISPSLAYSLFKLFEKNDSQYVDAPVLGSLPAAENGNLKFLLKLYNTPFEKIQNIVDCLGSGYSIVTKSKTAQEIKLFHNTMCAILLNTISKILISAEKFDSDPNEVYNALGFGALNCDLVQAKSKMFEKLSFKPLFPLKLMYKDLKTLYDDMQTSKINNDIILNIINDYDNAMPKMGELDCSSIYLHLLENYNEWK